MENNPAGWLDRSSSQRRILYDMLNRLAAIAAMCQPQNSPDLAHTKPTLLYKRLANWWEPLYIGSLLRAYPRHANGTANRRRVTWPRSATLIWPSAIGKNCVCRRFRWTVFSEDFH